jgi:hypothetical protein
MPRNRVAIAWLRQEEWPQWQALDPELSSYDDWLRETEWIIAQLIRRGDRVEKFTVHPDYLLAWCRAVRRRVDRDARAQFAGEQTAAIDLVTRGLDGAAMPGAVEGRCGTVGRRSRP